jgi:hypothetical protein
MSLEGHFTECACCELETGETAAFRRILTSVDLAILNTERGKIIIYTQ